MVTSAGCLNKGVLVYKRLHTDRRCSDQRTKLHLISFISFGYDKIFPLFPPTSLLVHKLASKIVV